MLKQTISGKKDDNEVQHGSYGGASYVEYNDIPFCQYPKYR